MSHFRYYPGRGGARYLLDVQSSQLERLATRVVIPLVPLGERFSDIADLNPLLVVEEERLVMMTSLIASVPRRALGAPLGNLLDQSDDITRALGILLNGF
ncbi:CcdB family protein [Paracraurococcus lichenis]|uniref:Toxin CcdB n=1 Tax=Paracraurococcus lichenis TaxID=3064888 RepID=A0ABT9DXU6_9PROT|nr:CcdB family protein [Paracraurococcus sp. LOR1-02]MDO9708716.1 CcdB family protein [Paracraurococcus sp. LOR1-02]